MKKKLTDSIRVATPCSESWDDMTGNEQIRFCSHCSKNVNNISEMTRKQAMRIVRDAGGNLCVRYRIDPKTKGPVFPKRVANIARYGVAAGVLGASLTIAAGATYAQGDASPLVQIERTEKTGSASAKVSGYVVDPQGAVIPYALVTLTNQETLMSYVQNASAEGYYEFKELDGGKYKLRFEAGGFQVSEMEDIYLSDSSELQRTARLGLNQLEEKVEVSADIGNGQGEFMGGVMISDIRLLPTNELVSAVLNEDFDNVKARVLMRARINARDKGRDGMSPLHAAVETGNVEIAEYLLQQGAKVNIRDFEKRTPLMMMDEDASPEMFDLLVRYGAKLTLLDKEKNSVLHHFAENSNDGEIVRRLVAYGVNVNAPNKQGLTPLMIAAENGNPEVAKALIETGADVNAISKDGRTVLSFADGAAEIKALLETYGAVARTY